MIGVNAWGRDTDHGETAVERGRGGEWYHPSLEGAIKEAGFKEIRTSITNRQNTVAQYIVMRPLLDLCEGFKQRGGARVTRRWWDQKGIDWETAKTRVAETDSESEIDTEEDEARSTSSGVSGSSGGGMEWRECQPLGCYCNPV